MPDQPSPDAAEAMSQGLAERLRSLLLVLDRQDRLETAGEFAGWLGREREAGRLPEAAREVLLRALRAASDPINFEILRLLNPLDGIGLARVMRETGLERVAASERVNDLTQAGLASRELLDDQIRGTALSGGLVTLVEGLAMSAGMRLADQLERATAGTGKSGGSG